MKKAISITDVISLRSNLPSPVGLVPTMGFLHEGHLSLIRAARKRCSAVVVSIFVNPTQFDQTEDLNRYPHDLERDLEMLASENVDLVWIPIVEEMYPAGFQTWVIVDQITKTLEGAHRPGHFRGVCTIVAKLLNVVRPEIAFFGQKDAQQVLVIQRMIADLNIDVEIIVCPTIREPDGLAKSSRNIFLNQEQRAAAVQIYRSLLTAQSAYFKGENTAEQLKEIMIDKLHDEPMINVQYISCSDPRTLKEISGPIDGQALLSLAVAIGDIRLIDNLILGGQNHASHD